jgi:plastocyanin
MAYIVKAQYGRYIINDESYSSIFVTTGNTITFDVSHSSNTDHPLKISTTKDGTHGVDENGNQGTELDDATAIVNNGAPGDPNAQIMFTPALDGIFYYYCEHHANMGSSITSVQTKFTDLGATAYDAQDGDITNRITKKIYKKDGNNVFQLVASIDDPHGNPWEVLDIDITEQASYKIEYNAKGLDDIDASNQPLERYINIAKPLITFGSFSCDPFDHMSGEWSVKEDRCVVGFVHASQCDQPYNRSAYGGDYQDNYSTKVSVLLVFLDKDGGDKRTSSSGQFPRLREAAPLSTDSMTHINYTPRDAYAYMDTTFKNELIAGNQNYVAYIFQNNFLSRLLNGMNPVSHTVLDQTALNMVYDMFKNTSDGQVSPGEGDLSYLSPNTSFYAGPEGDLFQTGTWRHSQLNSYHDIIIFSESWHNASYYSYGRFCMDNVLNTIPNKTNGPWIPQDPSATLARSNGMYRSPGAIESHKLIFDNFKEPDDVFEQGLVWNDMNYTIPTWIQVNENGATSALDSIMSGQTAKFIFPIKQNF